MVFLDLWLGADSGLAALPEIIRRQPGVGVIVVTVHCPLLSGDLMTSTLFGHRKGAFTGATADARGKVEEAEHGTLFLDEVADASTRGCDTPRSHVAPGGDSR